MHSIVPLRADGSVAHNCIVWADTRSQAQADYIATHSRTPLWNPAIAPFSIAKVLWLREHEPEVFGEVAYFLFSKDYLRYRMTGEIGIDYADASGSLIWDFALRQWDRCLASGTQCASFFVPAGAFFRGGGGHADGKCGARPGFVTGNNRCLWRWGCRLRRGRVGGARARYADDQRRHRRADHRNAGTSQRHSIARQLFDTCLNWAWTVRLSQSGRSTAPGIRWIGGETCLIQPCPTTNSMLLRRGNRRQPTVPLFLPYLQGTGTPYLLDGPYGSFTQLSATADKRSLTRAVMDGIAFGIKLCAEALVTDGTLPDKKILFTGGVPKSPLMRAILNNVFAGQVTFRGFSDMSALGAAAHAAVAVGISADAAAFLADFDYGEITPAPNPLMQARYAGTYARYKEWADRITNV